MNDSPSGASLVMFRLGQFILTCYVAVSVLGYALPDERTVVNAIVFLYVVCFIWLIISMILKCVARDSPLRRKTVAVWLCMYMISALWVNKTEPVFGMPTPWYTGALLLVWVNTLSLAYVDEMSPRVRELQALVLGLTAWIPLYLVAYLSPVYVLGVIFFWLFGLPLMAFAPLLFSYYNWRIIRYSLWKDNNCRMAFMSGAGLSLVAIIGYCCYYAAVKHSIEKLYQRNKSPEAVAAEISSGFMEDYVLQQGGVYAMPLYSPIVTMNDENEFFSPALKDKIHDPLLVTAVFFCGRSVIPLEKREEIANHLPDKYKRKKQSPFNPPVVVDTSNVKISASVSAHQRNQQ